ncbi:TPA: CRISPR-associated protein Cas1 [Escherichia coli]|nr:CRISPR-associated protein Cas1 [Escherichia coli]EJX3028686.1 CRISPR-associated protein Cas1 [Escherichia coli]HAI6486508.1 CRISPR-associated protein Cas1 [Escherichia coli]HAL5994758.1 CRISPR-associated protein Cas1 [Escherichia coli]HBA2756601.1 CRISPR-associated protein Cas1 [Escherichia coli]
MPVIYARAEYRTTTLFQPAGEPAEPDKEVRLACRDIFRSSKLTGKLIPLIEEVLAAGEIEPPQPAPDMLPPAIPEPETLGDSGHRGRGG